MTPNKYFNSFIVAMVVAMFLLFMLGPILAISVTSFNSSSFPRISPWDCFTTNWYEQITNDSKIMRGFKNSLIIGVFVTFLSVVLGLAGALLITQLPKKYRISAYFLALIPVLVPGIVIGISTLVFWGRLNELFAIPRLLTRNGYFLTILGQTSFISSYCMLIFMARLSRFDAVQEEAAKDLGATPWQSFYKVLLPYLRPAILSAAVVAFLSSLENYNTTVFTSLSVTTFTLELGAKVRQGLNPSISALTLTLAIITFAFIICNEFLARRRAFIDGENERLASLNNLRDDSDNSDYLQPLIKRRKITKFFGIEKYYWYCIGVLSVLGVILMLTFGNYQSNQGCIDELLALKLEMQRAKEEEQKRIDEEYLAQQKAMEQTQNPIQAGNNASANPNKAMFNAIPAPSASGNNASTNPNKGMFNSLVPAPAVPSANNADTNPNKGMFNSLVPTPPAAPSANNADTNPNKGMFNAITPPAGQ